MRLETCIRKAFGMRSHYVVQVKETEEGLLAEVGRLANRKLRCGSCGLPASGIHNRGGSRRWKDLAVRDKPLWLQYRPYRVRCFRCGVRTERVPWAHRWARVTHVLARAVAVLARKMSWSDVAAHYGLEEQPTRLRVLKG